MIWFGLRASVRRPELSSRRAEFHENVTKRSRFGNSIGIHSEHQRNGPYPSSTPLLSGELEDDSYSDQETPC